jgi:predicted TIM-barrel fold metal-dependent hydrolase
MIIDTHIHVGPFNNAYFSAVDIHNLMHSVGVDYYAVSSMSQCEHDYEKVLDEIAQLIELSGDKVLPVMWITPDALDGNIAWYLESDIKWRMLKIHPFLDKTAWSPDGELFAEVIDIARELKLPLLIHTGDDACCSSALYARAIESNEDVCFILAHGRPLEDAIRVVNNTQNAYLDTAFMPIEQIKECVDSGISKRVLWGTDMCIPKYYRPELNLEEYYLSKLRDLQHVCTAAQFEAITYGNAKRLFKL